MKPIPGVALVLLLCLSACTKVRQSEPTATSMSVQVVTKIETAMKGNDKATRAQVLLPELREVYLKEDKSGFAVGTFVKLDRATFKSDGEFGVAEADVSGQGRYTVSLVRKNEEWFVFNMDTKPPSARPVALRRVAIAQVATNGCKTGFGKRIPVLFVHGLNASQRIWLEDNVIYRSLEANSIVMTDTFDYEAQHSLWVDQPKIGPELAKRVACLANESRKAGGSGKVIIVAHSMGGLATRFAGDQTDEFTGKKVADSIGFVVTIGTPHKGAPISDVASALLQAACNFSVLPGSNKPPVDGIANCKEKLSAIFGMRAFMASGKVDQLPMLPAQIPLLAIAGDVRSFVYYMGVPLPVFGSDLIVPVSSAAIGSKDVSKGGGVEVVQCLSIHPYPIGNPASCEHGNLVKDAKVKEYVVAGVTKYLNSLRGPAVKFNGMTLQLPAGWKVTSQKPDEWELQDNCPGGTCKTFSLWGPKQWATDFCEEVLETRPARIGQRVAKYMLVQCDAGKLHIWVTTSNPLVGAISWNPPTGLEELLTKATWN